MGMRFPFLWLVVVLVLASLPLSASAGVPTEQLKGTTDKIISILTDPELKGPSHAEKRRGLIRKTADERFDWDEMSRRSLGYHWAKLDEEQRKTFVNLFSQLLERTYMEKVEDYSGEKVSYVGETIDGDYATVEIKVLTTKNVDISVINKMKKDGEEWMIYDVSIEGVSLVNNYRTQFNSILSKSSFSELLAKLREKVSEK
jgi:phospholipid transport system substrate-binding protein